MEITLPSLGKQIEREVNQFLTEEVQVSEDYRFSQYKLTKRISLFETQTYPSGKFDTQGNYKFWYDIISSRVESEIKNIDFDTKDILVYSPRPIDELPNLITNLKVKEYLRETGQAEEINSAIEEGSGWGNVVWKKVKGGYERVDLRNFYVINQSVRTLKDTSVVERHQMTAPELRAKKGTWNSEQVDKVLKSSKKTYKTTVGTQERDTTVPYYEIYERNGEISLKDLKEYNGEKLANGDENKYLLARVIGAGTKGSQGGITITNVLFADKKGGTMSDIYKEYHRGRYKSRWWREGLYEVLFDLQVRANQIGNQIAQGLELASKTVLRSNDNLIVQNILSDIRNGDIIKTKDLEQVSLRIEALDQLMADWNRTIDMANELANSREIVQGITPPSGTPLGTSQLLNQNAGKLFDFLREKLAIPFSEMLEKRTIPSLVEDISGQEVLRLTGDSNMLNRLHQVIVDDWYLKNLVFLPPHTAQIATTIKAEKLEELKNRPQLLMKGFKELFKRYKPHVSVIITGEQVNLGSEIQTLMGFAQLEADPVRRSAILELIARKKGVDFGALPKSEQGQMTPVPASKPVPAPVAT